MRIVGDGVVEVRPELDDETVFDREAGKIRVLKDRCRTCIIGGCDSLAKVMHPGELKRFLDGAVDSYVICHSTGPETATQAAVCHGWDEKFGEESTTYQRLLALFGSIDVELEGEQGAGGGQRGRSAGVDGRSDPRDGGGAGGVPRAAAVADEAQHGGEGVVRDGHARAGGDVGDRLRRPVGPSGLVSLGEFFRKEQEMAAKGSSVASSSASSDKTADQAAADEREAAATPEQPPASSGDQPASKDDSETTAPADQTSVEQSQVLPVGQVQGADEDEQVPDPKQYETDEYLASHGTNPLKENPGSDY